MLVKYWMNKEVITLGVDDSMQEAIEIMKKCDAALIPILEEGKLVGVITDTNLKRAAALDETALKVFDRIQLLSRVRAGEIMTKNPITVPPNYILEETAALLMKNKISGAPVVNNQGQILGTITQRDLFREIVSFSVCNLQGVQLAFRLEDRPGSIREVTDIIRSYGCRLRNILTSHERAPVGYWHVYVGVYGYDRRIIPSLLKELREKVTVLYVIDWRENDRQEFVEQES